MSGAKSLLGRAILVVEDEYFIATDIADLLASLGADVVGPCRTIAAAELAMGTSELHAAVLDINVGGSRSFDIANALTLRGVPFLFISGYDDVEMPLKFAQVARLAKPLPMTRLAEAISVLITSEAEEMCCK